MIRRLVEIVLGLIIFEVGFLVTSLIIPLRIFKLLLSGRKKVLSMLFDKKKHTKLPEVGLRGYKHDYVRIKSGTRFHYVHAGHESKPLMLCIHGFPECWYSWKHVLKRFSSDYHVVAFDMRGYGDSDKPEGVGNYHVDYLVNDVKDIVAALGYKEAVLVAHDWGAAIAWRVAALFPNVVSKLIVMNAPHGKAMQDFALSHPSQFLRSWYMFFFQIPFFPEWLISLGDYKGLVGGFQGKGKGGIKNSKNFLSDEEVEIYKYSVGNSLRYAINYYRAVNPLYRGIGLKPGSAIILQPILIIWGKEDFALDYRMVTDCEKYCKNPRSVLIEGASHWVQLDEPEKVCQAMKEFLEM